MIIAHLISKSAVQYMKNISYITSHRIIILGPLISKKDLIGLLLFSKRIQQITAAAILLGPKNLRVPAKNQCEITRHVFPNASLRILELLGGMYSTYF